MLQFCFKDWKLENVSAYRLQDLIHSKHSDGGSHCCYLLLLQKFTVKTLFSGLSYYNAHSIWTLPRLCKFFFPPHSTKENVLQCVKYTFLLLPLPLSSSSLVLCCFFSFFLSHIHFNFFSIYLPSLPSADSLPIQELWCSFKWVDTVHQGI